MNTREIIEKIKNKQSFKDCFVKLIGSEKQIKWAESLRKDFLDASIEELQDDLSYVESIEEALSDQDIIDDVNQIQEILNETEAGMIIAWHTNR